MNVSNAGARRIRTKRPRQRPYASAMKDKVISESFIDRDSADSADIFLVFIEIALECRRSEAFLTASEKY